MHSPADSFSTHLEVCYEVLLYLAHRMEQLAPGEVLEFLTSDPHAPETVLPWLELRGYELLHLETLSDGQKRFWIRR